MKKELLALSVVMLSSSAFAFKCPSADQAGAYTPFSACGTVSVSSVGSVELNEACDTSSSAVVDDITSAYEESTSAADKAKDAAITKALNDAVVSKKVVCINACAQEGDNFVLAVTAVRDNTPANCKQAPPASR